MIIPILELHWLIWGDYKGALDYHKKAIEIHRELGDRVGISTDYTNIGFALYITNKVEAIEYLAKSIANTSRH